MHTSQIQQHEVLWLISQLDNTIAILFPHWKRTKQCSRKHHNNLPHKCLISTYDNNDSSLAKKCHHQAFFIYINTLSLTIYRMKLHTINVIQSQHATGIIYLGFLLICNNKILWFDRVWQMRYYSLTTNANILWQSSLLLLFSDSDQSSRSNEFRHFVTINFNCQNTATVQYSDLIVALYILHRQSSVQ